MTFHNIAVYGGGLIGSAWAVNFVKSGLNVTVYDIDGEKLDAAKTHVVKMLSFFADPEIGILSPEEMSGCLDRLAYTADVRTAVENAEFIQENGPENLNIKQSIIKAIEEYNQTAVIASSTSGQLITDIAAAARHPERIVAGHPFNPVHIMPLVEISGGEKTSRETVEKALRFYKEIGKEPVLLAGECRGFICNRLQNALNREVQDLVSRGICSVEDIDKAVTFGLGIRWGVIGPHMILELAGGDGGIEDYFVRFNVSENSYKDLACWTKRPENYKDLACTGVKKELESRPPGQGRDHSGLERFRDKGLIHLLRYHGKY